MFGNPVAGVIRPFGSPSDGTFRVTAPFGVIDPFHPTPHGGTDIGNGKCGEPLLAMTTGRISLAGKVPGSDALIIRGIDPAQPDFEWAVAHCATVTVKVGQIVLQGDRIGTLGKTGTTACHCHIGAKQRINGVWVSVDPWPLLDQNVEGEVIEAPILARITNRQTATHANTKFRGDPSTSKPELAIFPPLTLFQPDYAVKGAVVAGTAQWYTGMLLVNGKPTRGYFHESTVGQLAPVEQADCTQAVTKAVAPLNVTINAVRQLVK